MGLIQKTGGWRKVNPHRSLLFISLTLLFTNDFYCLGNEIKPVMGNISCRPGSVTSVILKRSQRRFCQQDIYTSYKQQLL